MCVCWGGWWQIIVYVQVNKTVSWFFSSNFTSQRVLTQYTQNAERRGKKECIYNQNTLCGKVIIQNLSRDKAFPRVFLVAQWLKNLPSMQGDTVLIPDLGRSRIQCSSSWTCVPWLRSLCSEPEAMTAEPTCHSYESANMPQSPRSAARESTVMRSQCTITSVAPTTAARESPHTARRPAQPKINKQD